MSPTATTTPTSCERASSRVVRLRQINLISLERKRLRADLILAFKIFKGEVTLSPSDFFLYPLRAGLRGHPYLLLQEPIRLFPINTHHFILSNFHSESDIQSYILFTRVA